MSLSNKDIEKLIKTTMIGSVAKIENIFGPFWGHGKSRDERTEKQQRLYELFMELREQILDLGNEQIRKIKGEDNG